MSKKAMLEIDRAGSSFHWKLTTPGFIVSSTSVKGLEEVLHDAEETASSLGLKIAAKVPFEGADKARLYAEGLKIING